MWDEVEAINLVSETTTIPIPKILRAFEHGADGYMVMDYVGGALLHVWRALRKEDQSSVAETLRGYIDQLRAIPLQDFPGPVSNNLKPKRCHCPQFRDKMRGPFDYSLFEEFLNEMEGICYVELPPASERQLFDGSSGYAFTHNNIGLRNIFADDGKIYLSNWADAGFYPMWFDAVGMEMIAEETRAPRSWSDRIPNIAGDFAGKKDWLDRMGYQLMLHRTKTEAKIRKLQSSSCGFGMR
ncbi:hypothetical protein BD410DRAFT_772225 [Rickenella mellea]|uniref:Aminoglycoside phosphotransferase domain-containing protein n=1 Tax=Rickenella mellea TaxID=50990 RepID=A0A4Y7PZJ3_9AGAM|nr:hypothetical protein BD410DRAFT_772225 [Rickenella mellea]